MAQAGWQPFAGSQKGRCGCGSSRCCLWLFTPRFPVVWHMLAPEHQGGLVKWF